MDDLDDGLDARLTALEGRAPARNGPPAVRKARRGRFALSLTMAPILLLAIVGTAAAGAVVVSSLVGARPGIQNPDQPLAGSHMECMTPPEAAAFLRSRGYTDVIWQVEAGGADKGSTTSVQQATPPEHGYVVPGSILYDGRLHMIVDQRAGASGTGDCFGRPLP